MKQIRLVPVFAVISTISLSCLAQSSLVFFDLGRHDGGVNGNIVANPTTPLGGSGGFYWNSIGGSAQGQIAGTAYTGFVASDNTALGGWTITIGTNNQANGFLSGGLASFATGGTSPSENPSYSLLGDFAVANATGDYFFTTSSAYFVLSGLTSGQAYNFTFFGSRNTSGVRSTTYSASGLGGTLATSALTTSGTDVGAGGYDGNNNTLISLNGIIPDLSGNITIAYNAASGGFGYLNAFSIQAVPEPSSLAILGLAGASLILIQQLRRKA